MKYQLDQDYTYSCFRQLIDTHSTTGYYVEMNPLFKAMAADIGYDMTFDNKGTAYITVDGEDNSKTVQVIAHLDTVGFMVRAIDEDGKLRVRASGGINYQTIDGSFVTVMTRSGKKYTGILYCQYHSVHVFKEKARETLRSEENVMIVLDEPVNSRADVLALGIDKGDYVDLDPRCTFTPNGYIKSRFVDDKACVASVMTALKYLKDNGLKPVNRTIFSFPYGEEIGLGGNYIPPEVSEIIGMDIGLIGPGYDGSEHKVSICIRDLTVPYDYELTNRLVRLAKEGDIPYAFDMFYSYGSDAGKALACGANAKVAVFGMGTYGTHGMERTHIDGVNCTTALLLAYLLEK